MQNRKYLPTVAELIDRLSIIQLKEVFITEELRLKKYFEYRFIFPNYRSGIKNLKEYL